MRAGPPRPRPLWRSLTPIVAALTLAACDDDPGTGPEPGPCDHPDACVVAGPDLVVRTPVVLWPNGTATDELTGLRIVDPGQALLVEVTVLNRGDVATGATSLSVSPGADVQVPALEPGETFHDTVEVAAPDYLAFRTDTTRIWVGLDINAIDDDPIYGNDRAATDLFHVALPVLVASVEAPDTFRIGGDYTVSVTLANVSRHAALDAARLAFCWIDFDTGCGYGLVGAPFGLLDVPTIEPGDEWTMTADVTIPHAASFWFDQAPWDMYACVGPADATLDDFGAGDDDFSTRCIDESTGILALPDIEATCEVALVAADTALTDGSAQDCVEPEGSRYDVYAIDAVAGEEYELVGDAFGGVIDGDGNSVDHELVAVDPDGRPSYTLAVLETGRLYLLAHTHAEYALDLRRLP